MKKLFLIPLCFLAACASGTPYAYHDFAPEVEATHQQALLMCDYDPVNCGYALPYYMK